MKHSYGRSTLAITSVVVSMLGWKAAGADEIWRATGFKTPESVLFDEANGRLIVSNINGGPVAADGNGYLSILSTDGKVVAEKWVSGMDAPKGMAIARGKLYAADITKVRVVDLATGKLIQSIDIPGSVFLNDMTADSSGVVYVSDMMANTIHRIDGDKAELWIKDEALAMPNGVLADDDRLIVVSWGKGLKPDFTTQQPGGILAVDFKTKAITPLSGAEQVGNLDGVILRDGSVYFTDYMAGGLYRYKPGAPVEKLDKLKPGSADIGTDGKTIFIPMMNEGEVIARTPD